MDRLACKLTFFLLLCAAAQAYAQGRSFLVSPSGGVASISNISGYGQAAYGRLDAAFFPLPEFGIGIFGVRYRDFKPDGNNSTGAAVKVTGSGLSVTGRWIVYPRVQPYVRAGYMYWNAEASALGQSLTKQSGGSLGLTLGLQFPIVRFLGAKVEISGYDKISDANIRQISAGLTFEF